MVHLRDKVKDTVTGTVGIATGKAEYMTGCVRFLVETKKHEELWFDETRLKIVKPASTQPFIVLKSPPAGPRNDDSRRSHDAR